MTEGEQQAKFSNKENSISFSAARRHCLTEDSGAGTEQTLNIEEQVLSSRRADAVYLHTLAHILL